MTRSEFETGILNSTRAEWASQAVDLYRGQNRCGDDWETAITDLMADLCHLANREGSDVAVIHARAFNHYFEEAQEVDEKGEEI